MELKIEDLKVGDELECIDKDYAFKNLGNKIDPKLIVSHICDDVFSIGSCLFNYSDIKYFKNKEQSQQCTFEEIVSEARTALDKGLLKSLYQADRTLSCVSVKGDNTILVQSGIIQSDAFDFIQSLYKETFVIETEEDLNRVNGDAEIVLMNGSELPQITALRDDRIEFSGIGTLYFYVLKGATVTQSK